MHRKLWQANFIYFPLVSYKVSNAGLGYHSWTSDNEDQLHPPLTLSYAQLTRGLTVRVHFVWEV